MEEKQQKPEGLPEEAGGAAALDQQTDDQAVTQPAKVEEQRALVEDTPLERARFACQRMLLGKSLEEVCAEAPRIDPIEFYRTVHHDPEARAYYEEMRQYRGLHFVERNLALQNEMLARADTRNVDVRKVAVALDNNRWTAERFNKPVLSVRPHAAEQGVRLQVINTNMDLGDGTGSRLPVTPLDADADIWRLPSPMASSQSVLPAPQAAVDAEFSEVPPARYREEGAAEQAPRVGWHIVGGQRQYGVWDKGPPSRFVPLTPPDEPSGQRPAYFLGLDTPVRRDDEFGGRADQQRAAWEGHLRRHMSGAHTTAPREPAVAQNGSFGNARQD
jgi:hypothetical protein